MTTGKRVDLMLQVDEASAVPLYIQIYDQIKDAICTGTIAEGEKLVSIRSLSSSLGVSHTTVEQSYRQLMTEGLITNIPRSGYVVSHVDIDYLAAEHDAGTELVADAFRSRNKDAFFAENKSGRKARYDFSYANLQPDSFPATIWRRLTSDVLYRNDCPELARYTYTDEPSALSEELADCLGRTRAVRCKPEQVILQAGTDGALSTIFQLFDHDRDVLGMEEPGYATVREVARRLRFSMIPLPSDAGPEPFLEALDRYKPRVIFTTPSHQFPTGRVLSLDARTRLLKWAEENDAFIIEDDSCNEFRYLTRPIPSLQSLDVFGRVIYLCNISKVLSPALRIAYIVLPPKLLSRYWELFNYAHPPVSWLEQEVLARFIAEGHWDAHVRRVAKGNRHRHDELIHNLMKELGEIIEVSGTDTGMHLYVTVENEMTQNELLESAGRENVQVYGTSRMWFSQPAPENNVMIGFSAIAFEDIRPGVAALARSWRR